MHMAIDRPDVFELRASDAEQLKMNWQEIFPDDVETGTGQKMMDIGDTPRDRVLDWDHAKHRRALGDGSERVLEGCAGQRLPVGINVVAGNMRIRTWLALVGDFVDGHSYLEKNT